MDSKPNVSLSEDYHVHCNYNDHSSPDLTVNNVVHQARKIGLTTVALTEHVRKTSDWIPSYLSQIEAVDHSDLHIIPGFEAKILPDGSIDCLEKYAGQYFVVASFHSIYNDKRVWIHALEQAIQNPDVNVLGHLAAESSFTLSADEIKALALLIRKNNKIVELNAKYHRPPIDWIRIFKKNGVRFHLGSDAHSLEEIGCYEKISDLIAVLNE